VVSEDEAKHHSDGKVPEDSGIAGGGSHKTEPNITRQIRGLKGIVFAPGCTRLQDASQNYGIPVGLRMGSEKSLQPW